MFRVTANIIHDKRFKKKDGTYGVKLQVIHQRIVKRYTVGISLTKEDWKKVYGEKPRNDYKKYKLLFDGIELRANNILTQIVPFTFEAFEKAFDQKQDLSKDIIDLFDEYIAELKSNKQFGTADSYGNAKSSFISYLKFKNRKKLNFGDITPKWLQSYEDWMGSKGKSITTVGIYVRSLRRVINKAIESGSYNKDFYPFGKGKYQIPGGRNIKKALTFEQVKILYEYVPESSEEMKSKDMWMLSYLCNGANFKDIAHMRYRDIGANSIVFIREKTKRTTKEDIQPIIVGLTEELKALIKKWAVSARKDTDYVFGIINDSMSEEVKRAKMKQETKNINKYVKRMGEELEFPLKLTLGVARHTWATVMKNFGASDEYIGDGLGHQNLTTTKSYLGSFEDSIRNEYQSKLLKF